MPFQILMKSSLLLIALLSLPGFVVGNEVYFDTVSTKKASRNQGSYMGVFGGGVHSQTAEFVGKLDDNRLKDDDGWLAGIEFGYEFKVLKPLSLFTEAEFTFMSMPFDGNGPRTSYRSDLRSLNAMLNFGVQLDLHDQRNDVGDFWANFRPFAGVGVGGAWTRSSSRRALVDGRTIISDSSDSDISWAYQVFAGIEYAFSDYVSVYGEWRRMVIGDIGSGYIDDPEFDLWLVGLKLRY